MPIRPMPFEKELPPEDLEKWNEIKRILTNQELCFEQHFDLDSTDTITSEEKDWTRSFLSRNPDVMKAFDESNFSTREKILVILRERAGLEQGATDHDEKTKMFTKFKEALEMKSKNDSEKISDYELLQEPNDQRFSNVNWFDISDSGDLTPLYEPGGRVFAWNLKDQMKNCLKSIVLNHPKSCPDVIITTILPRPHQPHQGTEIHSKIALYWCTKVLREDGSYERSTKTTSDGLEEDWRGVYPLSSEIETFASCIREKINKLCRTFVTYQRFVLYRTEA
jgi:hypothetical protein